MLGTTERRVLGETDIQATEIHTYSEFLTAYV